jgi:phage baseplate assembly protein W
MKKIAQSIAAGSHGRLEIVGNVTKQYYSDLDPDFRLDTTNNDVAKRINSDAVQQSLIGIVSTRKGERPFEPEFGSDLHSSLFENMSDFSAYAVEKAIDEAINNYEPRVRLKQVIAIPYYDSNTFVVSIEYHIITDLTYIYNLKLRLKDDF